MTSNDIRGALEKRYAPPEWALFHEVRSDTGFARRSSDAVAMNLYRSRGMEIHGFEIKVSRGDLLRELRAPAKAEDVGKYCDRWWLVVPAELKVDPDELPDGWGLLAVNGKGCCTKKKAPKLEAVAPSRGFVAAALRRAREQIDLSDELLRKADEADKRIAASYNEGVEYGRKDQARQIEYLQKKLKQYADFEKIAGISIREWDYGDIGRAVHALRSIDSRYGGLGGARNTIARIAEDLQAAVKILDASMEKAGVGAESLSATEDAK